MSLYFTVRIMINIININKFNKAKAMLWNTKKTILQVVLNNKCIKYIRTIFKFFLFLCQADHMAIVINK